jgi:hypothetical protein
VVRTLGIPSWESMNSAPRGRERHGCLPAPIHRPPPSWGGESTSAPLQAVAASLVSTRLPGPLTLRAYFLLNLLAESAVDATANAVLTSAFAVGAEGVEPSTSAL